MRKIFDCPPEIISNIFVCTIASCRALLQHSYYDGTADGRRPIPFPRLYQEDDHEQHYEIHNQRRDIALVCRRWYAILCCNPSAWVDIIYSGQTIQETLPLWIGRTGSLPLNVSLYLPWAEHHSYNSGILWHIHPVSHAEEFSNRLLRLFMPIRHRIRVLDISCACSVQMAEILKHVGLFLDGNLIESIALRHSELCDEFSSYFSEESPVDYFPSRKSNTLRHLAIACLPLSTVASYPQLSHLTALDVRLDRFNVNESWSIFKLIATRAVNLRNLQLTAMWVPTVPWASEETLLELQCLDALTLILGRSDGADSFLHSLYMPMLCRLSVDWTTRPGAMRDFSWALSTLGRYSLSRLTVFTISCLLVDRRRAEEALNVLQNLEIFVLFNINIPHKGTSLFLDIMLRYCLQGENEIEVNLIQSCILCPKLKVLHTYDSDGRREMHLLEVRKRMGFDLICTVNQLMI